MLPQPLSNGCSQPKKPEPKWVVPTLNRPARRKSHNHCAELLVESAESDGQAGWSSACTGNAGPSRALRGFDVPKLQVRLRLHISESWPMFAPSPAGARLFNGSWSDRGTLLTGHH